MYTIKFLTSLYTLPKYMVHECDRQQLTFIPQATEADAVLAIALYEESLASLLGKSLSPLLSEHF